MVAFTRGLSLVVVIAFVGALAPPAAFAQGSRGHVVGSSRSGQTVVHRRFAAPQRSVFPQPVDPWKSWGVPHVHRRHHGHSAPFMSAPGLIGTPSLVVTSPVAPDVVQGTTILYAPLYAPSGVPGAGPSFAASAPLPTLVEHPSGWYQLRGDGVTSPYGWVWIPKSPAPPPPSVEPAAPAPARSADSRTRDERGAAYHWTDGAVTTWTNRLERVPRQFRDQAASTARPD